MSLFGEMLAALLERDTFPMPISLSYKWNNTSQYFLTDIKISQTHNHVMMSYQYDFEMRLKFQLTEISYQTQQDKLVTN